MNYACSETVRVRRLAPVFTKATRLHSLHTSVGTAALGAAGVKVYKAESGIHVITVMMTAAERKDVLKFFPGIEGQEWEPVARMGSNRFCAKGFRSSFLARL